MSKARVQAPVNVENFNLPRRTRLLILQRLTFAAGALLVSIYGVAVTDAALSSRFAIWMLAHTPPSLQDTMPPAPALPQPVLPQHDPSFGLWSTPRIVAYRASLVQRIGLPEATLSVPRLSIVAPVFDGTDDITLNHGLGRIRGTAKFGEQGNVGIAGHRDSFLRALKDVVPGDSIEVTTPASRNVYVVDRIQIVDPSDVGVLAQGGGSRITLVTCYPFYVIGPAPRRFVVQATLWQHVPQTDLRLTQQAHLEVQKEK